MAQGRQHFTALIAPRRLATAVAAVFILGAAACEEEPYHERQDRWRWVTYFPEEAKDVTAVAEGPGGDVYAVGQDTAVPEYPRAVVYRYDGSALREDFRAPYDRAAFRDIKAAGAVLWAAGYKTEQSETKACLYRCDGGRWTEVPVPASVDGRGFTHVFPLPSGSCWLETSGGVYTYGGGAWKRVFTRGPQMAAFELAVAANGRAFVYVTSFDGADHKVYVSDDRGGTWAAEPIKLDTEMYEIRGYYLYPAAAGESLFLVGYLIGTQLEKKEAPVFLGVIARDDAPPGEGTYEISYVGSLGWGGGWGGWRSAFRTADEGYVVGYEASLARERGEWYPEDTAWHDGFTEFAAVTAGRDAYWAVVRKRDYGGYVTATYLYRTE